MDKHEEKARGIACIDSGCPAAGHGGEHGDDCNRLTSAIASALRGVEMGERERCAKIADEWGKGKWRVEEKTRSRFSLQDLQTRVNTTGRGIAEDIRREPA
jgi:hypothetical protein